jgi:hypothetical protein
VKDVELPHTTEDLLKLIRFQSGQVEGFLAMFMVILRTIPPQSREQIARAFVRQCEEFHAHWSQSDLPDADDILEGLEHVQKTFVEYIQQKNEPR